MTVLSSCSEDEQEKDFQDLGSIVGEDVRLCACCGGWFIEINSETYRFLELPSNSEVSLETSEYPIQVKLDWASDSNGCLEDEIVIERIEENSN
ncbi:MAG: hypothetical protein AAFY41_04175 [Bacteroidota bacterium]